MVNQTWAQGPSAVQQLLAGQACTLLLTLGASGLAAAPVINVPAPPAKASTHHLPETVLSA